MLHYFPTDWDQILHTEDNDKLPVWVDNILIIRGLYFDILTSHSTNDASNSKVVTFPVYNNSIKMKKREGNKMFGRYYYKNTRQNDNLNFQC